MSGLQNLRDKISRKSGVKFSMEEINPDRSRELYSNLSRLVKNNEIMRVEGSREMFIATNLLKLRKKEQEKVTAGLELPGWREVNPNLFMAPAKGQIYSVI